MPFSPIATLPTAPQRNDPPDDFADLADAFVVALQTFSEQLNTFKSELETAAALIAAASAYADPGLLALAGNTPAADARPYYTGGGTSALTTLSALARTLLAGASAASMRSTLGLGSASTQASGAFDTAGAATSAVSAHNAVTSGAHGMSAFGAGLVAAADQAAARTALGVSAPASVTGGAASGKITLGGLVLTWVDFSFSGLSSAVSYGNGHSYTSWARAWTSGDDASGDVSATVTSAGTANATIKNSSGSTVSGTLFSIGV